MLAEARDFFLKATSHHQARGATVDFFKRCLACSAPDLVNAVESGLAFKVIGLTDWSEGAFLTNLCAALKDKVRRGALQAQLASYREVVEAKYDGCLAAMAAGTRQQVTEAMEAVAEAGYSDEAVLVAKRAVVGASVGDV